MATNTLFCLPRHRYLACYKPVLCSLDERPYLLTMTRLGAQPAEVVFLDDCLENVEVARHLGMQAILFEENGQAIAALQRALHM